MTSWKLPGIRVDGVPGDTKMRLAKSVTDDDGVTWPRGTIYHPHCGGFDNVTRRTYQEVTINHLRVRFHELSTVQP